MEVCVEFRLSEREVRKLLRSGQLVGYKLPVRGRRRQGHWRILDPGEKFAQYLLQSRRHIEHIPLASSQEFAEVLGVKRSTIRQWKRRGRVSGEIIGSQTLYSVSEVRRVLFWKNLMSNRGYSPILVAWLTGIVEGDQRIGGDILDKLLRQALPLPEPERSKYVTELWNLFDQVNRILKYAREFEFGKSNLT